jgi:RNA ligase (TIGR02306 family)
MTKAYRKLARIEKIDALNSIEGADKIECASILGWKVVVKKGEFNVGDLCVYFEIDSVLPFKPWSEFLKNKDKPEKPIRLKTIRFRGQLSQGLALPLNIIPNDIELNIGNDVTELLGVEKYEPIIPAQLSGIQKGAFPGFISKTDELRIQSYPEVIDEFMGKHVIATVKMDGTSFTCYRRGEDFGVCSRNFELVEGDSSYWKITKELDIQRKLEEMDVNYAIQGELCGPGIQGNKMGLKKNDLYVFNIYDIDEGIYLDDFQLVNVCQKMGLKTVPSAFDDIWEWNTPDELLAFADTITYENGSPAEGVVIRPAEETYSKVLGGRLSIKAISNKFLEKHKE